MIETGTCNTLASKRGCVYDKLKCPSCDDQDEGEFFGLGISGCVFYFEELDGFLLSEMANAWKAAWCWLCLPG